MLCLSSQCHSVNKQLQHLQRVRLQKYHIQCVEEAELVEQWSVLFAGRVDLGDCESENG